MSKAMKGHGMSVAEFALALTASVPIFFATHECVRIFSIHRSAEVLLLQHLSKTTLSSLSQIQRDTFAQPSGRENEHEILLKQGFENLVRVPVLQWQWSSLPASGNHSPLLGVRVSVSGPTRNQPLQPVQAKATLCLRSWLEPLIHVVADGRSCVGEFLSKPQRGASNGRGVTLRIEAKRIIPMTVPVFHFGVYRHAELAPRKP